MGMLVSPGVLEFRGSQGISDFFRTTRIFTGKGIAMFTRRFLSVVLLALFASVATLPLAAQTVLDGKKKSIIVVGYSTSYAWPQMLQDMLDKHSGGERRYHVLNAVVGGSPVETWIAARGTPEYEATIGAMVRDFLAPGARLRVSARTCPRACSRSQTTAIRSEFR